MGGAGEPVRMERRDGMSCLRVAGQGEGWSVLSPTLTPKVEIAAEREVVGAAEICFADAASCRWLKMPSLRSGKRVLRVKSPISPHIG